MRVAVVGLWHLGSVTAACLASAGHTVAGLDFSPDVVAALKNGRPPVHEPGLADLVRSGLDEGRLAFSADPAQALRGASMVLVTYDTPVDDDDRADVEYVLQCVRRLFDHLEPGTLVLISSQLPVGSTARLERDYAVAHDVGVTFGYSPENLRLGKAIAVFMEPDRVVVGVRHAADRERVTALLAPITARIEWMSVESAEMTKHAVNSFLATSVTFINEIAELCERVGADAKEVERGLKSERRIGPGAYVSPGSAFAGGTLARDVAFLTAIGREHGLAMHALSGVRASNDAHKGWVRRRLVQALGALSGKTIALWGLAYKAGTDTLRRSGAIELCAWLLEQGARVRAHDPVVKALPPELQGRMELCSSEVEATAGADALVVSAEWPDYAKIPADLVVAAMKSPVVVDINRFLASTLGADDRVRYLVVGRPG